MPGRTAGDAGVELRGPKLVSTTSLPLEPVEALGRGASAGGRGAASSCGQRRDFWL